MDISSIQRELDDLVRLMSDKGIVTPSANFTTKSDGRFSVGLFSGIRDRGFDGEYCKWFFSDDPTSAISKAREYIPSIPDPENEAMRKYMRKLGEAVDFGVKNGIAAEYVDPVRITQKAMTDNLLSPPAAVVSQ